MDAFLEYRTAHDEMQNDPTVASAWDAVVGAQKVVADAQARHAEACQKFQDRMSAAAEWIKGAVLEQGKSVTLHNVEAKYTKGRASTSWKSVAVEVGAPSDVIARHTTEGEPSVSIRALEEETK